LGELDEFGLLDIAEEYTWDFGFHSLVSNSANTVCFGFGTTEKVDPDHVIHQMPHRGDCPNAQMVGSELVGLATELSWACRKCPCNATKCLTDRHLVTRPKVTSNLDLAEEWFKNCDAVARDYYIDYRTNLPRNEWMNKWSFNKRKALYESCMNDQIKPNEVELMIKVEGGHARPSRPRGIQMYRTMATQNEFGPKFYAAQKAWTATMNESLAHKGIHVTFGSGLSYAELGEWLTVSLESGFTRFYERDGKNWDATMQRLHHEFKVRRFAALDPEFAEFVNQCYKTTGYCFTEYGLLKYTSLGTTKSGHNDTTSGNSIINAAILVQACLALGLRARIIVAGDDALVALEPGSGGRIPEIEKELGIIPDFRFFDNWEDVSFISGSFCKTVSGHTFVPKFGRQVARLFWTTSKPGHKPEKLAIFKRGVILGLLPILGGIPVMREFLEANMPEGEGPAWDFGYKFSQVSAAEFDSHQMMDWLCRKYHTTPGEIESCSRFLLCHKNKIGVIRHTLLDKFMEVDLADLSQRPLCL
jgi:hypothetical protein